MGGEHQKVDRPVLLRDTKGGRRHADVDTAGCEVICGTPTTLRVKRLMMTMMMMMKNVSNHAHGDSLTLLVHSRCAVRERRSVLR